MLKHATISRTSRAQQTLQLQRHWQHQDKQQKFGCNQGEEQAGPSTSDSLESRTISGEPMTEVQQVDSIDGQLESQVSPSANRNTNPFINDNDDDEVRPLQDSIDQSTELFATTNQSPLLLSSQQKFLQPSSCCSSPVPSNYHPVTMQFTNTRPTPTAYNNNYHSPAKSRSTPSSLTNSPMKLLSGATSRHQHRSSTRSSRFPTITNGSGTTSTLTRTCSNNLTSPTPQQQDSMIKIFAQTLSQDVEYITLHVNTQTKSQQIIKTLLRKFRLKHRDPNLFHLTLERWIRKDGLKFKSVMLLGDEACPLQLQQCCSNPPHNDIKFTLQMRSGALVKIYCSDVVPDAKYKCLSLSTQTTVEETIELMLYCLNLASQSSTKGTSTDTHHHHQRQFSGSPNSSSVSSASSDDTSSSSGIESEPNNNKTKHSSHANGKLDSDSRASSVTSISSSSNVSSLSSSLIEQYCMLIECKDSGYKRVLHPDEYLVDVYQGLLAEASKTTTAPRLGTSDSASLTNHQNTSGNSSTVPLSPTSPDQWFFIRLKRRAASYETNSCLPTAVINHVHPRQNVPLPPIPAINRQQQANSNNLRNVVSTTQIEVNRPGSSLATSNNNSTESELMREIMRSTPIMLAAADHLAARVHSGGDELDAASASSSNQRDEETPPPPIILLTPPVRPRRRNLSNASSTFGRPLTSNNRRRYDPAQLAEDLDKLNLPPRME